jgi:hypothetical protein
MLFLMEVTLLVGQRNITQNDSQEEHHLIFNRLG